ncbi:MAG: hypothetical protein ABH804_01095 [archaeon]
MKMNYDKNRFYETFVEATTPLWVMPKMILEGILMTFHSISKDPDYYPYEINREIKK